jgi:hypothetical protein
MDHHGKRLEAEGPMPEVTLQGTASWRDEEFEQPNPAINPTG